MKQKDKKIIYYNSPEAATYKKDIEGWVSADGYFYGKNEDAEHLARWHSCTHKKCNECGEYTEKHRNVCESCYDKKQNEKYKNLPEVEWDGESPFGMFDGDTIFFDYESFEDYCEEEEIEKGDVKLCPTFRIPLKEVDLEYIIPDGIDWNSDPEDCLDKELLEKLDELNKLIREHKTIAWEMNCSKKLIIK